MKRREKSSDEPRGGKDREDWIRRGVLKPGAQLATTTTIPISPIFPLKSSIAPVWIGSDWILKILIYIYCKVEEDDEDLP